jgi:SNF2 family DNA or RNA helicase
MSQRLGIDLVSSDLAKPRRQRVLRDVFASRLCRVVIASYQIVTNMIDDFTDLGQWDYVILDEGHVIKNPATKTTKAMGMLRAKHRLLLTG